MSFVINFEQHVNDHVVNGPPISRKQAILRDPACKPIPSPFRPNNIPAELCIRVQWIAWCFVWNKKREKWDKPPTNPHNGRHAEANNPTTWGTFAQAIDYAERHHLDGVGFEFSATDPYAGMDLDDCRDPVTGEIAGWAQEIITEFNTYTEVSPTGTGVKLVFRGTVGKGIKTPVIELYDRGHYFTMTGLRVPNTPDTVADAQPQLDRLIARLRPQRAKSTASASRAESSPLNDEQVIARAKSARNGAKFSRLWDGDTTGYASASEADLALCNLLAYWTRGDRAQIDRLFRQSKLFRAKWDDKHHGDGRTYGDGTIDIALASLSHFRPAPNGKSPSSGGPGVSANHRPGTSPAFAGSEALDDVTLSIAKPHRTDSGAIRAILVMRRGQQHIDEIPISSSPSNRERAAKQIAKHHPNADRLRIDATLTRLVTLAGQIADTPPTLKGENMHEIVLRIVGQYYGPKYRTPNGFYAERLGEEIVFRKFITHFPTILVTECAGASDAPVRHGVVHRGALLKAIEVELKIYYADLIEMLPVAVNADFAQDSAAAKEFRTQFNKLLTSRRTFEAPKNENDRPHMASLISRAARMVIEGRGRGHKRWLRVLEGVNFWMRFRATTDGELQVWFAIRWEAGHQVGLLLPGVSDQESFVVLGTKYGIIDPASPMPTKTAGGRQRLAILRRDFTQPLLDDAGDFDDDEEPAPAAQADAKPS